VDLASSVPLGSEPRGTQDHILLSQFLRLPQLGGPGSLIYIPQEQGGPVIPPGTGFPFRRLLRLAGLRWRYSNPAPHGRQCSRLVKVKAKVTLRPTISRPVRHGIRRPSGTREPIFLSPRNFLLDGYCLLFYSALSDERTGL
jgi:hypothetical protein